MHKYVTYGTNGPKLFVVQMHKLEHSYKVEVFPCDIFGAPVSDAVAWDMFPTWWGAFCYFRKQVREFTAYANH
jgi:hypothetical protein